MKNELMLYQSDTLNESIEVKIEDDTVWLSQQQMSSLFKQTKQNISLHINNCFKENELDRKATVKESLTVQNEGGRKVSRKIEFYNLDVIISVGYRVKSVQGTQFRMWANRILKDYLLKGYALNNRMNRLEDNVESIVKKVNEIDLQIQSSTLPNQGVFFEGQVFDAYTLASRIIRSAEKQIILIDNYIDESTLTHLSKKNHSVQVVLLSKSLTKTISLDLLKANQQFGKFEWIRFERSHDRFLIIDGKKIYHLGASLKDLGKKWFAFSELNSKTMSEILLSINQVIKNSNKEK
jgi:hypothetical protein